MSYLPHGTTTNTTWPICYIQSPNPNGVYQQMSPNGWGGPNGSADQNLEQIQEALNQVRRKHQSTGIKLPQEQRVVITDRNESRIFKTLLPVNRYVHEDEHMEWLKGRTLSVCRKVAWSKAS